jgi:hypothetical protein
MVIACLLMRTRLPPPPKKEGNIFKDFKVFLSDPAFVGVAIG